VVQIAQLATGSYWQHMGMKIVEGNDGKSRVALEITDDLLQIYGNVHGGVLAGLLDSAIAIAVNQKLEDNKGASTVEMKLNYLRPANKGTLYGEGEVIQKGNKIIVGRGEIKDAAGRLVALGTATFMVTGLIAK
jgi:acyl-CoA thioesterase